MADSVRLEVEDAEFDAALLKWAEEADQVTADALRAAGRVVADDARASFGQGDGPHAGGGRLEGSIDVDTPMKGSAGYEIQVGPQGVVYARRVELGKVGARSARAHPYLSPGLKRAQPKLGQVFAESWKRAQPSMK